jgi:hypothetical protein
VFSNGRIHAVAMPSTSTKWMNISILKFNLWWHFVSWIQAYGKKTTRRKEIRDQ